MARYGSAQWRPFGWMNRLLKYNKTQLTFHITAGSGDPRTISSWIRGNAGANFVIFPDGRTVQLSDSRCKSPADYGAKHTISAECVGVWGPLTPAQVEAMKELARDAHKRDGVPLRAARTSSDAGIGWHRLGVDGNFPSSGRYAGRLQRSPLGVKTSGSRGKACPTEPVIDQILDQVIPGVSGPPWKGVMGWGALREGDSGAEVRELQRELLALGYDLGSYGADGDFGPVTTKAVKRFQRKNKLARDGVVGERTQKAFKSKDWFDMATKKDLQDAIEDWAKSGEGRKVIANAVWRTDGVLEAPSDTSKKNPFWSAVGYLRSIRSSVQRVEARVEKLEKGA